MYILEGKLVPKKIRIGIVASHFNESITSRLLPGALDCLRRHEVPEDAVTVAWAPGAFEIPLVTLRMASNKRCDAVICLGAVIRDSTSHYDYVYSEVSKGITQTSLTTGVPVTLGTLTTKNIEQAIERARTKMGNKDYDCVAGTMETVGLIHELRQRMVDDGLSTIPPVQGTDP